MTVGVARSLLLWASQNDQLKQRVPRWRFVRRALRKFMPGESLDDAVEAAIAFDQRGISSTFTHLGENISSREEARAATEHYLGVLDRVADSRLDAEISVKLTHLGQDLSQELAVDNLMLLVDRAAELTNWVWIDMESSDYVDRTIAAYRAARAQHPNVGICLQSYLHRTEEDIADLLPLRPGIRLVKGAYHESPDVAVQKRAEINSRFRNQAIVLLRHTSEGVRLALASHDVLLLDDIGAETNHQGVTRHDYEIQMLYGIRMQDQFRMAEEGYAVRNLIAYGSAWYPWYVRRLAERPANVWFVLRSVLPPVDRVTN